MPLEPIPINPGLAVLAPNYYDIPAVISPVILVSSNTFRKMLTVYNDSSAFLYLKFGSGVSTTNFNVKLRPHDYFEFPIPIYIEQVEGLWSLSNGAAKVTEFI